MSCHFQEEVYQTKIKFLQEDNYNLKDENNELKQLLKLNKQVIQELSSQNQNTSTEQINNLFQQLFEENQLLMQQKEIVIQQRDEARSQVRYNNKHKPLKCLIHEQIAESAQSKEYEVSQELQNRLNSLREQQQIKDEFLRNNQSGSESFRSKLSKNIKCFTYEPASSNIHLHNEIEYLTKKLSELFTENEETKKQKKNLTMINQILSQKLKKKISDSITSQEEQDEVYSEEVESVDEESNDSEVSQDLPIKVIISPKNNNIQKPVFKIDISKAQTYQNLSVQKQEHIELLQKMKAECLVDQELKQSEKEVLNLDLQPVVMNYVSQSPKSAQTLCPNKIMVHINKLSEQVNLVQNESLVIKLKLQDEMLYSKLLAKQLAQAKQEIERCENANLLLIQSQNKYEYKWTVIHKLYNQYYEFYCRNQINSVAQKGHPSFLSPKAQKVENTLLFLNMRIPADDQFFKCPSTKVIEDKKKNKLSNLGVKFIEDLNERISTQNNNQMLQNLQDEIRDHEIYVKLNNSQ